MSKHTPRSWTNDHERVIDATGNVVALITNKDGDPVGWPGETDIEAETNAHLIAAAPDLLAACEQIAQYHTPELSGSPAFAAMCDAIVKARGEP